MKKLLRYIASTFDEISYSFSYKPWWSFRMYVIGAFVIFCSEVVMLESYRQLTGNIAKTTCFNILFASWELPFAVSREWDLIMFPAFIFILFKIFCKIDEDDYGSMYPSFFLNERTLSFEPWSLSLIVAYIGASILGIIYAVPLYVALMITIILLMIIYCMIFEPAIKLFKKLKKGKCSEE